MLLVPANTWGWMWDSQSTTDTPLLSNLGVQVVASGSVDTKGSWANISTTNRGGGSVTTLAKNVHEIELFVGSTGSAAAAKSALLDVGVDPAGGTSYGLVVSNLIVGQIAASLGNPARFRLPLFIPAGSSVAVRMACVSAGNTGRVWAHYFGSPSRPDLIRYKGAAQSVGVAGDGSVPTNCDAVAFTPGNSGAWGSWTSLGTAGAEASVWNMGVQLRNATVASLGYYFELGVGDGTNILEIVQRCWAQTDTSERIYWLGRQYGECAVPAGATLYVRGVCSGTADTGWTAAAHGI